MFSMSLKSPPDVLIFLIAPGTSLFTTSHSTCPSRRISSYSSPGNLRPKTASIHSRASLSWPASRLPASCEQIKTLLRTWPIYNKLSVYREGAEVCGYLLQMCFLWVINYFEERTIYPVSLVIHKLLPDRNHSSALSYTVRKCDFNYL